MVQVLKRLKALQPGFLKALRWGEGALCAVGSLLLPGASEHLRARFASEQLQQLCPRCNNMLG